jgi:DedD protein
MDQALKQRLVGAVVLIALAVIFLPVFISGPEDDQYADNAEQILIPPAPDSRMSSKRLPVIEDGASLSRESAAAAPQWPIAASPSPDAQTPSSVTLTEPAASHAESDMDTPDDQADADDSSAANAANDDWLQDIPQDDGAAATNITSSPAPAAEQFEQAGDRNADTARTEPAASAAPAAATLQLSASGPDPAQWHVQVASLGNPDNVRRLQQQLQDMSLQTITEGLRRDDTTLYRVVTGPYTDQSSAQQALQRIRAADERLRPVLMEPEGFTAAADAAGDQTATAPQGLDRYAVQVGVFSTRERGDEVVASLQNAGFAAYQETIERADDTLYRVRIGPLLSEQDGKNIAARIKRDLELNSMVVDYR